MATFNVTYTEKLWFSDYIEADSKEEAIEIAKERPIPRDSCEDSVLEDFDAIEVEAGL